MNDKLDIPVYVISLNKNLNINKYKKYFNNVIVYPAIDVRKHKPKYFLDNNIISFRVYNDLINGRKDHFAFSGVGGIGLYLTHRKLFQEFVDNNVNTPVLIFEDDCVINNPQEFIRKIKELNNNSYDCAIFGPSYKKDKKKKNNSIIDAQFNESNNILDISKKKNNKLEKDFDNLNNNIDNFILYHSSLWSKEGIKKMNKYLKKLIEFQIDGYISLLGKENYLDVKLEKDKTTSQSFHRSSLDNDNICKICDMDANNKSYTLTFWDLVEQYTMLGIFLLIIILLFIYFYRKSKC